MNPRVNREDDEAAFIQNKPKIKTCLTRKQRLLKNFNDLRLLNSRTLYLWVKSMKENNSQKIEEHSRLPEMVKTTHDESVITQFHVLVSFVSLFLQFNGT